MAFLKNPKNNCLFHKQDYTKNRFSNLYSQNSMNVGAMGVAGHYY